MMVKGCKFFLVVTIFIQDIITIPYNVINIYCVYELDSIDFLRNNEFTIQNALFGIYRNYKKCKYFKV